MARLPRPFVSGIPSHLVVRGNNRQSIFLSEGDRIFFHRCLGEVTSRFGVEIHAFVLMPNHAHLLATGKASESLPAAMQALGRRYVSYFNYLHKRSGGLWEGRYRMSVVGSDRYFLACQKYIELNPVRAGMVDSPEQFVWSSHRHHLGMVEDDLVRPHRIFLDLAAEADARVTAYRRLFSENQSSEELGTIRSALNGGWALGDEPFCATVERATGRRVVRVKAGRKPRSARANQNRN